MKKVAISLLVAILLSVFGVSAQPAVPDLSSFDWTFVGVTASRTFTNGSITSKAYFNLSRFEQAVLYVVIDKKNKTEDDIFMLYGGVNEKEPRVALKSAGKWYAAKNLGDKDLTMTDIKDANNQIIGTKFSLDTNSGLKTRDVIFPN